MLGCEKSERVKEIQRLDAKRGIQFNNYITLRVGDTFNINNYDVIGIRVSYMNKHTTTLIVRYNYDDYYVVMVNKTKVINQIFNVY